MTEVLKIYDKPEGKLKMEINLNQNKVIKVDCNLSNKLELHHEARIGTAVVLPEFQYPFAVFTENEQMLLWCENESDRWTWAEGFSQILSPHEEESKREEYCP